jgi:hypothetical protein
MAGWYYSMVSNRIGLDGAKRWFKNSKLHRDNEPAIEHQDGSYEWYQEGRRHRTGGPALVWAGIGEHWLVYGKNHRIDGPSSIYYRDQKFTWALNNVQYTFNTWLERNIYITDQEKVMLALLWA